jgi:hypothetical protein
MDEQNQPQSNQQSGHPQVNSFTPVNPHNDDMGFADENQEAEAASQNPMHYSHAAKDAPENVGPQGNTPTSLPNTSPVAGATAGEVQGSDTRDATPIRRDE